MKALRIYTCTYVMAQSHQLEQCHMETGEIGTKISWRKAVCKAGRQPLLLRLERQPAQVERNQGFARDVNKFSTGFLKKNNCVLFLFSRPWLSKFVVQLSQLFSVHSDVACAVTSMYVGSFTASWLFVLFLIQSDVN